MPIIFYCDEGSPPCRTVFLAAAAMNINLIVKPVNIRAKEQLTPEFLKINPEHTVPVIDDNGFYLSESRAIIQYLANAYCKNDSIYPSDPKRRALVDHRLYFDLHFLQHEFAQNYYPAMFAGKPLEEEKLARLGNGLSLLNEFLGKTYFAAGNELTLADFSIVTTLSALEAVGHDLRPYPRVVSYYSNCQKQMKDYDNVNSKGHKLFCDTVKMTLGTKM